MDPKPPAPRLVSSNLATSSQLACATGLISNWAFPYSPPEMDAGPAYRFCVNHLLELDDPYEPFTTEYVEVGRPVLAGARGGA